MYIYIVWAHVYTGFAIQGTSFPHSLGRSDFPGESQAVRTA